MFFSNLELKELMDTAKMFVIILEDFLLVKEDLETQRKCTFVVIFSYLLLSEKKYPNNNWYSNVFIIGGCHVILRISVFLSLTNTILYTVLQDLKTSLESVIVDTGVLRFSTLFMGSKTLFEYLKPVSQIFLILRRISWKICLCVEGQL